MRPWGIDRRSWTDSSIPRTVSEDEQEPRAGESDTTKPESALLKHHTRHDRFPFHHAEFVRGRSHAGHDQDLTAMGLSQRSTKKKGALSPRMSITPISVSASTLRKWSLMGSAS